MQPTLHIAPISISLARPLLARHYAAGSPARVCLTLGATIESRLVGVLTVSYPTLNARWRRRAWPGEYEGPNKRENARRLNAGVRRISRVVVHPRHRSRGIATALVEAYLRRALTERTEVVAAMGEFCGCFEAAGMKRVECGLTARDVRLRAALRKMRITVARLVDDRAVRGLLRRAEFVKELRAWADAAGATRKILRRADGIERLAPVAAHATAVPPRVFVAGPPPARRLATSPAGSGGGELE